MIRFRTQYYDGVFHARDCVRFEGTNVRRNIFPCKPISHIFINKNFFPTDLEGIKQFLNFVWMNKRETNLNNNLQPTSVNVLMINAQGMMLSVLGQDYFISYNRMPWLRDARISSVLNVRMAGRNAIEWPELDIDLEIESLKHPERYPLIMKRSPLDCL